MFNASDSMVKIKISQELCENCSKCVGNMS